MKPARSCLCADSGRLGVNQAFGERETENLPTQESQGGSWRAVAQVDRAGQAKAGDSATFHKESCRLHFKPPKHDDRPRLRLCLPSLRVLTPFLSVVATRNARLTVATIQLSLLVQQAMAAKRRLTPTKAEGSSGNAKHGAKKAAAAAAKSPPPSAGKKKKAPPPIAPAAHTSREKGKGAFLGKGGVLTLGGKTSGGGRGKGGGRGSNRSPGRGGHGGPKKGRGGAAGGRGAAAATTAATAVEGNNASSEEDGESEDGGELDEIEESSEDGSQEEEEEAEQVTGAKAKANKSKHGGGKRQEEDSSEGEESEQELQSFMEAFPGMSSDEEEGEDGTGLGGAGMGSDGSSSDDAGSESDEDEEDGGLMDVRFSRVATTRAFHVNSTTNAQASCR